MIKTGLDYKWNSAVTLRGGYNHSGSTFSSTQTFFNLLAPAVIQEHLHLGGTWTPKSGKELSVAYIHAFEDHVSGSTSIPPSAGGGNANLSMHQNSVQVSWAWNRNTK